MKKIFNYVKNKINNRKNKISKKSFCSLFLLLNALIFSFASGAFFPETTIEQLAYDITTISTNCTNNEKNSYLLVKSEEKNSFSNPRYEYSFWYQVFGGSRNAFLATINANKDNSMFFSDYSELGELTFVYSNLNNNKEYKGHWLHEFYHYELMFKGHHSINWSEFTSFIYIRESFAKKILNNNNPNYDEYQSLLGEPVKITIGNKEYKFAISNIILEINDVEKTTTELFDNWVLSYIKLPDECVREYCYIFNEYNYQNKYKLEYINENFNNEMYDIEFGKNNLTSILEAEDFINKFEHIQNQQAFIGVIFVIVGFVLLMAFFFLGYKKLFFADILFVLFSLVFFLLVYILLWPLSVSFKNVIFFSSFSLTLYLVSIVLFLLIYIVFCFKRGLIKNV